jgi:drug/metabolite transporter (DMT)-like permease
MNSLIQWNALLALAAALLWGGGDFSGGMSAKTTGGSTGGALRVVVMSHLTSFTALTLYLWLRGLPLPHGAVLAWGLGAGVVGGLSLTAFYIALSRGGMGASAAISGLLAAAIPVVVSILAAGSPGWMRLVGFVVAGMAIWMIAAEPSSSRIAGRGTTMLAVLAGTGFGIYFVALKMAGTAGPVVAMATARVGSLTVCSLLLMTRILRGEPEKGRKMIHAATIRWVLLTALLDTSGNMFFIAATQAGRLDVAAVLASLYPATTILLAAYALKERPTRQQGVGMLMAAAAVVMITL